MLQLKTNHMIKTMRLKYFIAILIISYLVVLGLYINRYFLSKTGLSLFAKRPFISVLVTSYNYESYIRQTLDSILAQTYKNYEVIIVDDGSTDNSVAVISDYVNKYKNFHLYQHDGGVNKGLPVSFKLGVEKAKGDYIAVLESDDYWTPNNLLEKVKMINKYPDAVIISNNVIPFGEDDNLHDIQATKFYVLDISRRLKEKNKILADNDILFNPIPTFSAVTIKTEILLQLDFLPPKSDILDLWLYRQIFVNYDLYYIATPLTMWRKHFQSYGRKKKNNDEVEIKSVIEAFERIINTVKEKNRS